MPSQLARFRKIKKTTISPYHAAPITETVVNGFFTVDSNWTVKYWNKAAEKILKIEASEILGENLLKKFAHAIPSELHVLQQGVQLKDASSFPAKYWGNMGSWFDVITYHGEKNLSVSFKGMGKPITNRNANPVRLLEVLTELYRFVTEITNDCLWEWDLRAKDIFWIDGGHKRIFGYMVENALVPQSFWESRIHPEDREKVLGDLKKLLTKESPASWDQKYRFKAANGSYLYVHDRGQVMYDKVGKPQRMIGTTQNITEKVLLEMKLAATRLERQREITDAVLAAQEKERTQIGTELNENLNQLLVVAKWNVQMAKVDAVKRDNCLDKSIEYLDHVIAQIRGMYKTLVIPAMHMMGVFDNIRNLLTDMNILHPVKFKFSYEDIDEEEDLGKELQLDIFRIVQEQVNNIIQHAGPGEAFIYLHKKEDKIILHISDNGMGCNTKAKQSGVGLINITSRAELYHGSVSIISKPGQGYNLKIVLPCANTAHPLQPVGDNKN